VIRSVAVSVLPTAGNTEKRSEQMSEQQAVVERLFDQVINGGALDVAV
jgi:hypothetical protein